jgi:hypothetical protein
MQAGAEPVCLLEEIDGTQVLTLRAGTRFLCADIPFYCSGGIAINSELLSKLSPSPDIQVLLKHGDSVTGTEGPVTISSISDTGIVINDKTCIASAFALPAAENELEPAEIIVVMDKL